VDDAETLAARDLLARHAGIFAEPSGAVALAGAIRLRRSGVIGPGALVVCVVTGHGLKQLEAGPAAAAAPAVSDLDGVKRMLDLQPAP
jgi:threonine synthase